MKLRNIVIAAVFAAGASACSDYLDVESPSKFNFEYVYGSKYEVRQALNGIYARLLSSSLYGNDLLNTLVHNSDIDFRDASSDVTQTAAYNRLDCDATGSGSRSLWTSAYDAIEHANIFIDQVEQCDLYRSGDEEVIQMLGEAKVMRAMVYHELVWYFGDIPAPMVPSYKWEEDVLPVSDRHDVLNALIAELQDISYKMAWSRDIENTVEHVSREMAWAMIARLALTNGGYTLMPDKTNPKSYGKMERPSNYQDYYRTAMTYCDSVIASGTHALNRSFQDVFVSECNYAAVPGDDVIFELPFAKNTNGNVGYIHGNKYSSNEGLTNTNFGEISGSAKVHSLARYLFDEEDLRRDYLFGLWNYSYDGKPSFEKDAYSVYNNKWSKLWSNTPLGAASKGSTGINYPYMRYTDVLLMYAEAVNEVENGVGGAHGAAAADALRAVRNRAFQGTPNQAEKVDAYVARAAASKESFLRAVLDERRYEFAGENMRWRDLVRNNLYGEVLAYTFLRSWNIAERVEGTASYATEVSIYDGKDPDFWNNIPFTIYYRLTDEGEDYNVASFPNSQVRKLEFCNLYEDLIKNPDTKLWTQTAAMYEKWSQNGTISNNVRFSLFGYIRTPSAQQDEIYVVRDGNLEPFDEGNIANLPPVRYIIPYPQHELQRAGGKYQNYYGY